ncbi:MAG TPA: hypothetical protein VF017_06760 [Thermoanaerobaculia bacterium]|nr:hypothetical protein [Thermoanaerobaculia bacterium]
MLAALERQLVAIVADGLAGRPALGVVVGSQGGEPAAGAGVVRVALSELASLASFPPGETVVSGPAGARQSRRVLPLALSARLELARRPAGASAAEVAAARGLLLDDLSLVAHRLADPAVRGGQAFAVAGPDPGFAVSSCVLREGNGVAEAAAPLLGARLAYELRAEIWPTEPPQPEGEIKVVDTEVETRP